MPTFCCSLQKNDLNLTSPKNLEVRRCCRASAASTARLFTDLQSVTIWSAPYLPGQVLPCSSETLPTGAPAGCWQLQRWKRIHPNDRGRVWENMLGGESRGDWSHPPPQHSANSCPVSLRHRQRAPWPWRPTRPSEALLTPRWSSSSSTTIPNSRGSEIDTKATCLFITILGASSGNTV